MPLATSALVTAFLFAVVGSFAILGGGTGVAYVAMFLLLCLPGLPLGFALFGRRHAAGWIAALPMGYAATTIAWWGAIFAGHPSTVAFVLAWGAMAMATWGATRRVDAPLVELPAWTTRDTSALCVILLLVPLLVVRPFAKVGSTDADGNRRYRAYFTADFVWHTALAAELAKHDPRPTNPFVASQPLHYYWTYFRVPASIAAETGIDVQTALKLNATATAFVFLAAIYLAAWAALPSPPLAAAIGVGLTLLGPSAEGFASIVDLLRRGEPLAELRHLNIDAVASWAFKGIRIDNLPRSMWYNPQHSFACALGLIAVPAAIWCGRRPRTAAIAVTGLALAASVAFNPVVGASFCAIYGATLVMAAAIGRTGVRDLFRHALAVVPVVAALAWCSFVEMTEGAGDALVFGLWGSARNATALNLLLQLGPILVPMAIGLWPNGGRPFERFRPALAGVALGLLLMHLVALTVSPAWMGFRAGQIVLVMAPALVARGLLRLWESQRRQWSIALGAAIVVGGFPTSIIDAYNAQDVTNRGLSPGAEFHWTIVVTAAEQEALDWIRTTTRPDAVVQADPAARARETWSYIPTFAERRMATGNPISLLPAPDSAAMNARVKAIYADADPNAAWQEARRLGIDYLYVGVVERSAYPAARKFGANPDRFETVFRNEEAEVFAVRRGP